MATCELEEWKKRELQHSHAQKAVTRSIWSGYWPEPGSSYLYSSGNSYPVPTAESGLLLRNDEG